MDKVEEKKYIFAIGRRKSSTAEVRLYRKDTVWGGATIKKGECVVNGKPALEYFGKSFEKTYKQPFQITGTENKFAVSIKVSGGGKMGQLDAAVLAIARALDKIDREKFHATLKKKGMLTRDPRVRERRKVGMGGKSRRRKQSPKR
ncbi:MAG: 30S ribosomal protein S9 [Candidatus Levybacteria bacterium GW2011_GWA2_37_36]|nr:MAG: 30S ribosomal protein S9 [Candidatus Levybacteria bacterium GW2011_GWA1_37_16]KKQ33662.1 MAG: 30S ribosomal protein S9 [Candidatus Levybacteria bacterium GW2011_GWA2_37_36]KKQ37450.1 MAG: 30S ribosomal protein S9 [Candidatus Levybacteria bacterium GW2011_GWC2_37_7]KKQ41723.1 MAG: 30S ribosomal protein S9 [Candidatus Levybacteria bacterium GW2011_GWB1_37_8]OGH51390.1 MAG: 30S ribosomal protein S9 [Candidatus Levybacteria bacterium RIFCSPLOWO2_12_FULL_37_14]